MTLDDVWRAAAPYLRVRKNDIHVPISFDYAERLLEEHPQADGLVVRLAMLLHDTGWHTIDERDIFSKGFGKNWKQSDVRYLHEDHVWASCTPRPDSESLARTWRAPVGCCRSAYYDNSTQIPKLGNRPRRRARSRFIGLLRPSLAGSVLSTTLFGFPVAIGAGNGAAPLQKIACHRCFPELSAEQREQGMTDFWGAGVYFEKRPKND